ncbi:MAG: DNA translocase FtsK 4TM domain-containing protein [Candidatus Magasanikbacteria bacterium]|nr:DNA translocase FtsK 4TM domain-containing protein [Candidatus Magasanikbacteria bacterium]
MPRRSRDESSLNPTLSRGIIFIVLVLSAFIITLSFFGNAGVVGVMLNDYVLSFLFGVIRFATPFIILTLAWFIIRDTDYDYRPTHILGTILFFISLCSLVHIHYFPDQMWNEAIAGHGGGVFGMFAWVLKSYLGIIAGSSILVALGLVSIFLLYNTAITHFVMLHRALLAGLGMAGNGLIHLCRKLFVRSEKAPVQFSVKGDYSEEDEEEEPAFAKKSLAEDEEEEDEEMEEEEEETEEDEEMEEEEEDDRPPQGDVWSKKVVIKNLPPMDLLSDKRGKPTSGDVDTNAEIIKSTFDQFGIDVQMGEVRVGPTVTQYTMKPAAGVKLTRITGLSQNLALALAAQTIRIEAPIPGKALVGVEVPNQKTAMVSIKELIEDKEYRQRPHNMMMVLGKDVAGKVWLGELTKMPHLLIAGATGSGKTVCVNTIIMGLLYQNTAETLRFIMVDPKRVELTLYNGIPHLLTPVITNTQKTVNALKWTIGEMERRFELLASVGSRDINSYNQKHPDTKLPYIVFVIDELADLMATAASEVEAGIIRIAQMARAVGIHLLVATQRPSVDVITGLMKANIPGRIAFSVASAIDSRTILDAPGAEKLLGRGDMLFSSSDMSKPMRIQGAYISEEEMKRIVEYLKGDEEPEYDESIVGAPAHGATNNMFGGPSDDRDPLFEEAKKFIIQAGKASASLLQRRLKVGYARAARLLDELEEAGVVGPGDGAKPREILATHTGYGTIEPPSTATVFDPVTEEEPEEEEETEESEDEEESGVEEEIDTDDKGNKFLY